MNKEKRTMNQVTKKENTDIALASMFEQDGSAGLDNMGSEDFAMPFLRVLGQLSPEINKRDAKYVEGAEAGMIFNTVTKQTYDGETGLNVIPCGYKREYVEWSDRGEGTSAPVAIHPVSSGIIKETTRGSDYKDRLPNGNYLENTASYFVLTESMEQALITMKSTQLKVSRNWNSMMSSIKLKGKNGLFVPAAYSHVYKLSTVQQSNDKGTWFGWNIEKVGPVQDKNLYEAAKQFSASVNNTAVNHGEGDAKSKAQDSVPF
jgi:hypothetical protein|tara:strand:+ start:109 stop:891 length:783 start_codon:yes stop_codon:yes gene_type:complete